MPRFHTIYIVSAALLTACPPAKELPADAGTNVPDSGTVIPDAGNTDFVWPLPISPITITPHASWKTRVEAPGDSFIAYTGADVRWVKFTVLMRNPTKVYFQDSRGYPLHAPFAIERLDPFVGLTISQFEQRSLHEAGQEAITGAVLFGPRVNEVGIQLVRADPYAKEMVKIVFDLVKSSIDGPTGLSSFYMPTYEQQASTLINRAWLEARGVPVSSADRWVNGSVCYSEGWALGRLVRLGPTELDAAYADGRLTVNDILVVDSTPAEVPPVAGIVTLAAATPNSHVAILATTLRIPFLFTPHADQVAALTALVGQQVVLRASTRFQGDLCRVDVFGADSLSPSVKAELLVLKTPPMLSLPPKQTRNAWHSSTNTLTRADIPFFGGKASHYGFLRRAVPNDSYVAIALSFDLWDDAMGRQVSTGRTLSAEITQRLAPISTWPPQNLAVLKQTLLGIRTLIENEATFSATAQTGVRTALAGFDARKGIRFRSSTNVEDTDDFTGAGLYDSATGCLADDDDADSVGPSLCNANKDDERGAFLAIRRVYASFYNDNAYLERLRHGVNEAQVGMALLVHPSVPDDDELANGVITYAASAGSSRSVKIVTQLGAESVTNPIGTAAPEVVTGSSFSSNWYFDFVSGSSLVPLGAWVMNTTADYEAVSALTARVADEYALTTPRPFNLDFEFKKQLPAPGKLWLKQVRPLPVPSSTATVVPFVINRAKKLCVYQGESSDLIALHRNRLRLLPTTRDVRLTDQQRLQSLFVNASLEFYDGDSLNTLTGAPSSWTGFTHSIDQETLIDSFTASGGRTISIRVIVPRLLRANEPPILTTDELRLSYTVSYAQPQITIPQFPGAPTTTNEDFVELRSCPDDEVITPAHSRQERTFTGGGGITVQTAYYWPPVPTGVVAGYTAPNVKWDSTTISGLTTSPLQLSADFAQTYRPQHHNFSEDFLFDPLRDPATTTAQRAELMTRNVRWLIISGTPVNPEFQAVGFDGALRSLP